MMRSLYSGVTGMRSQQMMMDVIGNNIANVGTFGYKSSRATFEDTLSELIRYGTRSTNPLQIGSGVQVGAINTLYNQGSMQPTGNLLDLGIVGDGFVVLENGGSQYYTRAASLSFDQDGWLVHTATGLRVMGWRADSSGNIRAGTRLQDIQVHLGTPAPVAASTGVTFSGILDARLADGETVTRDITVVDELGRSHVYVLELTRESATEWNWAMTDMNGGPAPDPDPATGTITFAADGTFSTSTTNSVTLSFDDGWPSDMTLNLDFSALTQTGGESSVRGTQTGGMEAGVLNEVMIDEAGVISGVYSNGSIRALGQIALAVFPNQEGLLRDGSNLFVASASSGAADTSAAAGEGRGKFSPRNLEMSNVDLSQEFVSMIVSQRAFQANSRIINASDELLQEIVNLTR